MAAGIPTKISTDAIVDPELVGRVRRGRRYRSVGWLGVVASIGIFAALNVAPLGGPAVVAITVPVLTISLLLVNWTRLWIQETKEPFQYTFSVGEFEAGPDAGTEQLSPDAVRPIEWLSRDLVEKLGERVGRLSLLEEPDALTNDPEDEPAAHVHISGWYGLRKTGAGGEMLEVVPRVRLGGKGAPAKLAQTIRFKLGDGAAEMSPTDYSQLFERVYWSVASQIYAQIREGVERKVKLLPPGRLRAAAYLSEADDYATSNTLDAYEAARQLYHKAQEIYDLGSRRRSATSWRRATSRLALLVERARCRIRRLLAKGFRGFGRREILTARAQLGYARMLLAEWHLSILYGRIPRETYEAQPIIDKAIERLRKVPADVEGQRSTLFRSLVTMAVARFYLQDRLGAADALAEAERLAPADGRADAELLLAAGMVERDHVQALRHLAAAVARDPTMERAHFERAKRLEDLWRGRGRLEPEVAEMVDREYTAVIALNPGNLAAWANRGYVAWLLGGSELGEDVGDGKRPWTARAIESLQAGRQYKEVRRDAVVAELDWNLTRIKAEAGKFTEAYSHYVEAVSVLLAEPRIGFLAYFFAPATDDLVRRFVAYKDRVLKHAKEAESRRGDDVRLVKSVKAFALNDCGLAHLAHFERSGHHAQLRRARRCFERAVEENPAFPLPHLQIAIVDRTEAAMLEPGQAWALRVDAARRLFGVLRSEPTWVSAQLGLIQTQITLLETASQAAAGHPVEAQMSLRRPSGRPTAPTAPPLPENDPRYRRALAEHRRYELQREVREGFAALLPHAGFRYGENGGRPDFESRRTRTSIARHRDCWTRDFNEIHVAALINWAWSLSDSAPAAAHEVLTELRRVFYRSDPSLVELHLVAIGQIVAGGPRGGGTDRALVAAAAEDEDLLVNLIEVELRESPVGHQNLRKAEQLPPDRRWRALSLPPAAQPSATSLIWIAIQRAKLGDVEGAGRAGAEALGRPVVAATAADWSRLGDLLLALGLAELATTSYRRAIGSGAPIVAAWAALSASGLLREQGAAEEAARVLGRAKGDPETWLELGLACERRKLFQQAVDTYRELLASSQDGAAADLLQFARVRLVDLLEQAGNGAEAEIEAHLRQLASGEAPHRQQGALRLAERLLGDDPDAAEAHLREAISGGPSGVSLAAAETLCRRLLERGDTEDAQAVALEAAGTHSWVAVCLGDRLVGLSQELAEEAYRAGANPAGVAPGFAADASLRLADLLVGRDALEEARSAYRAAIKSADIRVAPDATLAYGEFLSRAGSRRASEHFYLGITAWAVSDPTLPAEFAVAFCRDLGERLTALGKPDIARAVHLQAVEEAPAVGLRLAAALETGGDRDGAQLVRSRVGALA